jgi:peptide/nickel transport system permease protein
MSLGVVTGTLAGFYGGWLDQVIMRAIDVLLAFPNLVLALAIVGTLGPGIHNVIIGLVAVWWVDYARIMRSIVLSLREAGYVEAALGLGAGNLRIMGRHLIPNSIPPVIVLATIEMGTLLLGLAGLNFLGLGAQPPTPEWGVMINDGRPHLTSAPHLMVFPGLAITLVVMGFNLIGDGLRDALDPHLPR